jgi:hypothetical protein
MIHFENVVCVCVCVHEMDKKDAIVFGGIFSANNFLTHESRILRKRDGFYENMLTIVHIAE